MNVYDYTAEQIEEAIAKALADGELEIAATLVAVLAVKAPDHAQMICDVVELRRSA